MKKQNKITFVHLIFQNLYKRMERTLLLIFIVLLLSLTLFSGTVIAKSLRNGINRTVNRLGADIIVVPKNYVSSVQDALFMGEPCTVYFEREWLEKIQAVTGVKQVSSQLFLATLSDSECCENKIQMVAYDIDTDFVIRPWIQGDKNTPLANYQIAVGSNVSYQPGDQVKYFGTIFTVAKKLEKTGMGYDNCVFVNDQTAYELTQKPVVKNNFSIPDDSFISMITVAVKEGEKPDDVAKNISDTYGDEQIAVFTTSQFVSQLSSHLNEFTFYSTVLGSLLSVFSTATLFAVFTVSILERKKEYAVLRSIGATKSKIAIFIIGEAEVICFFGSTLGVLLSLFILYLFKNYLSIRFQIPYYVPSFFSLFVIGLKNIVFAGITGVITSFYVAVKLSCTEPYNLMRENEG